jgi:hypothetical protein
MEVEVIVIHLECLEYDNHIIKNGIGTAKHISLLHVNGNTLISGTSTLNEVIISETAGITMTAISI